MNVNPLLILCHKQAVIILFQCSKLYKKKNSMVKMEDAIHHAVKEEGGSWQLDTLVQNKSRFHYCQHKNIQFFCIVFISGYNLRYMRYVTAFTTR